jgi:hypothetical protein
MFPRNSLVLTLAILAASANIGFASEPASLASPVACDADVAADVLPTATSAFATYVTARTVSGAVTSVGSKVHGFAATGVFGSKELILVPTRIGQLPLIGGAVESIPVVGGFIAGPPHPILVGAVAVDTYVLPKTTHLGYTESSRFAFTDFNSAPRLRHYKNYIAPLPYTHPPIFEQQNQSVSDVPVLGLSTSARTAFVEGRFGSTAINQ